MINTGAVKSITICNDITNNNLYDAIKAYNECDLYIDTKFSMPLTNQDLQLKCTGQAFKDIESKLLSIENNINKGVCEYGLNTTQFKSFKAKVVCWCNTLFNDILSNVTIDKNILVFIDNDKISKHEWILITWLNELGVSFFIRCNNIKELNGSNIKKDEYTTNYRLNYKDKKEIKQSSVQLKSNIKNLSDIETALYDEKKPFKIIVNGIDNYMDTCDFYGKVYKESRNSSDIKLYLNSFDKPSLEQIQSIPRVNRMDASYIIDTMPKFLNVKNKDMCSILQQEIKNRFKQDDLIQLSPSIIYNKIVFVITTLNNIFNDNLYKYIIFYGAVTGNDKIVIDILCKIESLSILILTSDKSKSISIYGVDTLELKDSLDIFNIPQVDTRDNAKTLAAQASNRVNDILYSDNTLGLYRPGQFNEIDVKLFNTTFDEIIMWWNKEMHIRPGFRSEGRKVEIPTMFKVIKGVKGSKSDYINYIQKLSCGKTLLCKNVQQLRELSTWKSKYTSDFTGMYIRGLTDINRTAYNTRKPFFINGSIQRDAVRGCKNYTYDFMGFDKQEVILNRIEKIINSDFIVINSYNNAEFTDLVLNLLLNLNRDVLKYIQWFEYYTYNPNVVLTITDEQQLNTEHIIILTFLYLMGFDVLIFVPTGYNSVENLLTQHIMYDTHLIGEIQYDINLYDVNVTDNIEVKTENNKKQGFFSKLFSN